MNRFISRICALVGACAAFTASYAQEQHYELRVGDFNQLDVSNSLNVDYRCNPDSTGYAVFTTTAAKASVLMFTSKKDRLNVQISDDGIALSGLPTITVYSSALLKVVNDGDSLVRVFSPVVPVTKPGKPAQLQAKVIGNGRISLRDVEAPQISCNVLTGKGSIAVSGYCDTAILSITGTGQIQADGLNATDVNARITGTGTVGCAPAGKLSVHGMGSGKVYYSGTPHEVVNKSLGIKVEQIE